MVVKVSTVEGLTSLFPVEGITAATKRKKWGVPEVVKVGQMNDARTGPDATIDDNGTGAIKRSGS